jgi:hypothetical protein
MSELIRLGFIVGFEGEGSDDDSGEGGDDDDADDPPDDDSEDDDSDDDDTDDDSDDKGLDKLRKALKAERRENRKNSRELKKLQRAQAEVADKDLKESDKARKEADELRQRVGNLGAKFQKVAVDALIAQHATKLKFRDIDDALSLVKRDDIVVDQDEDAPDDVEVDEQSVIDALKALKKSKPHLILAEGDEEPSGGKVGGKKTPDELSDEKLRDQYPALRH